METLVAFLATASIGVLWSVCSPDFGVRAVRDRFAHIEPVVLMAVDGTATARSGSTSDPRSRRCAQLPTLRAVVLVPHLDPAAELDGTLP